MTTMLSIMFFPRPNVKHLLMNTCDRIHTMSDNDKPIIYMDIPGFPR